MKAELSRVHWGRILLTSILTVILVIILNTVLLLLATQIWGPPSQAHQIAYLVATWSTFVLQLVLTVVGAVWVAHKEESGAPLHGFLVGLVVALILFIFNPALTNFLQGAYRGRLDLLVFVLGTFFLIVAAGWLGGVLGRRGRQKS